MIVTDLMTKSPITVHQDANLADAVRIMLEHRVSGLPVVDSAGRLVGIVTEGDLLRRPELGTEGKQGSWLKALLSSASLAKDYVRTHGRHVSEIMTVDPIYVEPETSLADVAEAMQQNNVKRLPVLQNGTLVGVISRADLLGALALKLSETTHGTSSAETIRNYILSTLTRERWAPRSTVRIEVQGDVVNLEGTVLSEEERQAVKVIAENAPGVKKVNDKLTFVEPLSGMPIPFS